MKKPGYARLIWSPLLFLLIAMTILAVMPSPAFAQTPPPDRPNPPGDRPDPPPARSSPGTPGRESTGQVDRDVLWASCATIYGVVTNWGYQNEPRVPVHVSGASWDIQEITDDNGYYASDCLGTGIGLVNTSAPPGLKPLTTDIALRLGYKSGYELNLGLYSEEIEPSLYRPTLTANKSSLAPGEVLSYTINISTPDNNNQKLWNVMVTDLLPNELTPVAATSTVGGVEIWDNLLTADVGTMESGQAVVVTITAIVQKSVPIGTVFTNYASFISADNLVVQTQPFTTEVQAAEFPLNTTSDVDNNSPPGYLPETGAVK